MPSEASARHYEVMLERDGRWVIDRLAQSEIDAVTRAEELFADEGLTGVRVVRGRFNHEGVSFETTIFERRRPAPRNPPVRVAAVPGGETWCDTAEDLYGPMSRRIIGRVLRNFLDRFAITPTELLHHHRHIRQLERLERLLPAALNRVAAQQAAARGIEARVRATLLEGFILAIARRAKEARAVPSLGEGGLLGLAEAIAALTVNGAERHFLLRHAMSRALEDGGGLADKLERVAALARPDLPPRLLALVDELVAGLLASATLIHEVLGYQPHLGAALGALVDLALGRHDGSGRNAPAALPLIARLLTETAMPETRIVLLERIQRELTRDRPLCRGDAADERRLLEALVGKLVDDRGLFVGGVATVEAVARRSRRLAVVGGIEAVRFTAPDPLARLEQLLDLEKRLLAERQQQALATYMMDVIGGLDGPPAALLPLRPRIERTHLPPAARQAVLDRLPHPGAAVAG